VEGSHAFLAFPSQIANGKLRRGTSAPRHSIGDAAAYATPRGGSGKCTISAPKARRRYGMPLSRSFLLLLLLYSMIDHPTSDCCLYIPTVCVCVFVCR
jgi:hypothetical protein